MRKYAVVLSVALIAGACSSNSPDAPRNSPLGTSSSNSPTAFGNANSLIGDQTSVGTNVTNRFDAVKRRRDRPPKTVKTGPPPPLEFRPGPENSKTATTMNMDGQPVEVRIFKDHPQLARVEATWLGAKDKLFRITLRNGSTVETRSDQVADLATAPADVLVQLASAAK